MNAQVTQLKTQRESLLDTHEEDWYFEKQDKVESNFSYQSHPHHEFNFRSHLRSMCVVKGISKKKKTLVWGPEELQKLKKKNKSKKKKEET